MSGQHAAASTTAEWHFTRPDPPPGYGGSSDVDGGAQYFRTDLRKVAGTQPDWNLPWRDDMYLAYPSADKPDWTAFLAHVEQLNKQAGPDTAYKIVYIIRRAHRESGNQMDPSIDATGSTQCHQLASRLERAIRETNLPPPQAVVTSPLTRAMETTRLGLAPLLPSDSDFVRRPVRVIVLDGLRERRLNLPPHPSYPKNQRHDKAWIQERYPDFDTTSLDTDADTDKSPEATTSTQQEQESYKDVWTRVHLAFQSIFSAPAPTLPNTLTVVALVSHCHVIQTIQREITGYDVPEEERRDKTEFYVGETGMYAMIVKGERKCS